MVLATNLGYPRIGPKRELKKALESYWKGQTPFADVCNIAKELRLQNLKVQKEAGIDHIPSNDFAMYDQVLDMICTLGCIPDRYKSYGPIGPDLYFAMARGDQSEGRDVHAMKMKKWFDTNYHYMVPEFSKDTEFKLDSGKILGEYKEAKDAGVQTRPVIIGPVTFLLLGKMDDGSDQLALLDKIIPAYTQLVKELSDEGAEWIQIDEPALVLEQNDAVLDAYKKAYDAISSASDAKLLISTYFDSIPAKNLACVTSLPVNGLHADFVRGEAQVDAVINALPDSFVLSAGVINGRNIWKANFEKALTILKKATAKLGNDRVWVAPSCSLLHSPYDLDLENTRLDDELKGWMAFAKQKLSEIAVLAKACEDESSVSAELTANKEAHERRATSSRIHNDDVKNRVKNATPDITKRKSPFSERKRIQSARLGLPSLPTTTIGSFPQTKEVREARAKNRRGDLSDADYKTFLQEKTKECIRYQEEIDLDVLVHGEFERNDMVEYFGEQLNGFAFTSNGWVQSYGSRCAKPPVIFGDVSWDGPMTVEWAKYSQSVTDRPMKGMLTGPITILQWSFYRDDQTREATAKQIAFAIRDEVEALEKAGIKVIQIDEAAFREGLPLQKAEWAEYLRWAVESFKLSSCVVADETQIHTHMCYSEFNDIIDSVGAMDADVTTIETSRSQMELLDAFATFKYPNDLGPGVYDIHSPRVPSVEEMTTLMRKAMERVPAAQLWVNPDCGLKTRGWPETKAALEAMVEVAKTLRKELKKEAA